LVTLLALRTHATPRTRSRPGHARADLLQVPAEVVREREARVRVAEELAAEEDGALARAERVDAGLDLGPEVAHEALDRPCGGVAERADRAALDLLPGGGEACGVSGGWRDRGERRT
jgi:hypothetical protein